LIEVEIEDEAWSAALGDLEAICVRAAEAALSSLPSSLEGECNVTILLADDETLADLNARFRNKAGPTNVLSFPAHPSARPHLGDLALAFGVCSREADEQGKALADHLSHLVVHGVLHLVGYDHETEAEAEAMEGLERTVLAGLGVADPYAPEGAGRERDVHP